MNRWVIIHIVSIHLIYFVWLPNVRLFKVYWIQYTLHTITKILQRGRIVFLIKFRLFRLFFFFLLPRIYYFAWIWNRNFQNASLLGIYVECFSLYLLFGHCQQHSLVEEWQPEEIKKTRLVEVNVDVQKHLSFTCKRMNWAFKEI